MSEAPDDLERAAQKCDANAELYEAYARQVRREPEERAAFHRDAETCRDLARQIRALSKRAPRGEPARGPLG